MSVPQWLLAVFLGVVIGTVLNEVIPRSWWDVAGVVAVAAVYLYFVAYRLDRNRRNRNRP